MNSPSLRFTLFHLWMEGKIDGYSEFGRLSSWLGIIEEESWNPIEIVIPELAEELYFAIPYKNSQGLCHLIELVRYVERRVSEKEQKKLLEFLRNKPILLSTGEAK